MQYHNYVQMNRMHQSRPIVLNQMPAQVPLMNSPSANMVPLLQQRVVKFAPEPPQTVLQQYPRPQEYPVQNLLQRSKSLTSADNLISRSVAGLSLTTDINDINFSPETQMIVDKALEDPNKLSARQIMDLATNIMNKAVEGRRFALPVSKLSIMIISKEKKETFLEAMLNTCRQW